MKKAVMFLLLFAQTAFGQNQIKLGINKFIHSTGDYNTFVGLRAGNSVTPGSAIANTFIGYVSGLQNTSGSNNTFLGSSVGEFNTTGNANTFVGSAAGYKNTTGESNSFFGVSAGRNNITGQNNTFIGTSSGNKNTTGSENTFTGLAAGFNNTTGSRNTFSGYNSGLNMLTGNDNVFSGWFAGYSITGSEIVAIGRGAGTWATTVNGSVFVGKDAGEGSSTAANTGVANTFIGAESGNKNTLGENNVFLGYRSGVINSTGSNNVFLGHQSGYRNTTGSNNTLSGYNSGAFLVTGVNNALFGAYAGYSMLGDNNVAFGVNSGQYSTTGSRNTYLGTNSGRGSSTVENTGVKNTYVGFETGLTNTTGLENTFLGYRTGNNNTTGSGNLYLGAQADGFGLNGSSLQYVVAIGYNAKVSASNKIVLGDTSNVNMGVGIGTTNPSKRLEVRAVNPNESGIRTSNLTSNSPTLSGNGKALTVNNLGDIILVPMSGGGANTHSDSAFVRTLANTNFVGGNLGIGVSNPQSKLDVNGDIRLNGNGNIVMQGGVFIKNFSSGGGNTEIGYDAGGAYNLSGSNNTSLGHTAGQQINTGSSNTFIGKTAGRLTTSGSFNTFLGAYSGSDNITGFGNTFLGHYSGSMGSNPSNLQRSGAVGYNARVSINDAIVLGDYTNTNLKVGIGMHDPQFKLDVKGPINIRGINGGLGELKFMTYNFLQGDKNFNSAIGFLAEVDSQYVHSTAIGYKSNASANNVLILGGMGENAVNVGIGNSAPQSRLEITSNNEGDSGLMFTNLTQNFTAKFSSNKFLSVDEKGKVGLYNLSADQITLKISNPNEWSDKVFASNYQLMSINKVENFIKTEGHLPNIPSAKEMTEKGISTQEMFAKLLEKNEELMLYLLEQNKINISQAKEIEDLKKEVQKLKNK
jgi:trimeric autotransporter adhesin